MCGAVQQLFAQGPLVQIDLDSASNGAQLIPIGDNPMFHYRTQVVYGPPQVDDLSSIYDFPKSVRVHPSSVWNGQDIVPMFNISNLKMDIWFGDPFSGGTRNSLNISNNGFADLKADNPIAGFRFRPERLFVVGDRMVAYCSVHEEAVSRTNKIAILSADMNDIQSISNDPWTVHFVTAEYSSVADETGALWGISIPVLYEGAYWSIACDYVSTDKEGGQAWILKMNSDGTPEEMVRLHHRSGQTAEHWHGGCILFDGSTYKAVWHMGDSTRRLMFREIQSLSNFATNATTDIDSGISGQFMTRDVSELDWGPLVVAAGPDETTTITNSKWKNGFLLTQDPNDPSKLLFGGDTSSGLVERLEIDNNGVAVSHNVFNPMSRNLRQETREVTAQLNLFMIARNNQRLVGIVSNEFSQRNNVKQYSGIVQSDDGGATWGWVWRGDEQLGLTQISGIAVLSNGRVIAGSINDSSTVISIVPGNKVVAKPLFVGYRPTNILGTMSEQGIVNNANGQVVDVGAVPELELPPIVHSEDVFDFQLIEDGSSPVLKLIEQGVGQTQLTNSNMNIAYWVRRKNPTTSSEADRMAVQSRLGWTAPGNSVSFGSITQYFSPSPKVSSNDWIRVVSQYVGSNLTGTFLNDPSDLRAIVKGLGVAPSSGNSEVLFEYANIGYDRPALPFNTFNANGISSAQFDQLGLGTSWSMLVVMQIPEECWDSWSGNETGTWELPAPVLTISDASDSQYITLQAKMTSIAKEGGGPPLTDAVFDWQILDSQSSTPSNVSDFPLRTTAVIVALSKDGTGDLQYVIAGPHGKTSGSRPMPSVIDADTLRFSDIAQTDELEMYILNIQADCSPLTIAQLKTMVSTLSYPDIPSVGQCSCPADFNNDGTLNFFDISAFLSAFNSADPAADFTNDGTLNFFDISAFLTAFSAGCP